jgi:hypothetical protein
VKGLIAFLTLLFYTMNAFGTFQSVICGWQPGEIFLGGFHEWYEGMSALYRSIDYGENITLVDTSAWLYSRLMADAGDSTIYRHSSALYRSDDAGVSWTFVDPPWEADGHAAGPVPGLIYRVDPLNHSRIEKSLNYGEDYTTCLCLGFPDTLGIGYHSITRGFYDGEIYIWTEGLLFHSFDYGEHFTFQGDLHEIWGVSRWDVIINGAESGQVFLLNEMGKNIWRVYAYGGWVELIANFPPVYDYWEAGLAASDQPGELYMYINYANPVPGGVMHIYHTTDYGDNWTLYVHNINMGVSPKTDVNVPENITLHLYPNPANAGFGISYQLPSVQQVIFKLYNTLGHRVWQHEAGIQSPGSHCWHYRSEQLPSGTYFLQLQTESTQEIRKLCIIK